MAGEVLEDELLAKAVVIDGRKEWCCCSCSETNFWTRSKCRRCKADIPSVPQAKHMQAVSSKCAAGQHHRLQEMEKTKCWRAESGGQRKQNCVRERCNKNTIRAHVVLMRIFVRVLVPAGCHSCPGNYSHIVTY